MSSISIISIKALFHVTKSASSYKCGLINKDLKVFYFWGTVQLIHVDMYNQSMCSVDNVFGSGLLPNSLILSL